MVTMLIQGYHKKNVIRLIERLRKKTKKLYLGMMFPIWLKIRI